MSYIKIFWTDRESILPLVAVALAAIGGILILNLSPARALANARMELKNLHIQPGASVKQGAGPSIPAGDARTSLKILPLGDSITRSDCFHLGYRYYLWTQLVDAGVDFDYIGSMKSHFGGDPELPSHKGLTFDRDHEGHNGWDTERFLKGRPGNESENLKKWLNDYTPDIVLMHVGTCDLLYGNSVSDAVDNIEKIIDVLRADNPNVVILLAKLIPTLQGEKVVGEMNVGIERLAARKNRSNSPVVLVDLNSGFDPYNDLFDRVHPNIYGNKKMAAKWFDAIRGVLEEGRVRKLGT